MPGRPPLRRSEPHDRAARPRPTARRLPHRRPDRAARPVVRRGPRSHGNDTTTGRPRPVEGSRHEQVRPLRPRRRRRGRGCRLRHPAPRVRRRREASAAVPSVQPSAMPSPSATPSPTPSTTPSASPAASPPPLTQTFTSPMHGISVSYPEGWTARAATEPWTVAPAASLLDPGNPSADVLYDPSDRSPVPALRSQPIGEFHARRVGRRARWRATVARATEPIAVDGATGLIGANGCGDQVAVTTAGRGYWIRSLRRSGDDPSAVASYDRAWFEEVLATVQLQPEDAVDVVPSATP